MPAGAVCVSSALKRNKRTHGGSSRGRLQRAPPTVAARELRFSPAWTVSSDVQQLPKPLSPTTSLKRG